jgi:RNA processing factor Prp31
MNIKSDNLHRNFYENVTVQEKLDQIVNEMARRFNFKEIDILNGIYDEKTMHEDVKVYTMLYIFSLYSELTTNFRRWASEVLDVYETGDQEAFTDLCLEQTVKAAQGRYSSKVRYKTYSIGRSIDMLRDLDEDRCNHLITKYLAPDEFTYLDKSCQVMSI